MLSLSPDHPIMSVMWETFDQRLTAYTQGNAKAIHDLSREFKGTRGDLLRSHRDRLRLREGLLGWVVDFPQTIPPDPTGDLIWLPTGQFLHVIRNNLWTINDYMRWLSGMKPWTRTSPDAVWWALVPPFVVRAIRSRRASDTFVQDLTPIITHPQLLGHRPRLAQTTALEHAMAIQQISPRWDANRRLLDFTPLGEWTGDYHYRRPPHPIHIPEDVTAVRMYSLKPLQYIAVYF